jgi:hypothetical protein
VLFVKSIFVFPIHQGEGHLQTDVRTVRALAYKWIRIMFRCWKDRTPYDDSLYVKSLTKRGSHLAEGLNKPVPDSTVPADDN